MRIRALTPAGDMQFGQGQRDFYQNTPDGVAQAIRTRLDLLLGEWFLDTTDGTAWATQVLGKYTESTRNLVIRQRILQTPGVVSIDAYSISLDPDARIFAVQATVTTLYGVALITAAAPVNVL